MDPYLYMVLYGLQYKPLTKWDAHPSIHSTGTNENLPIDLEFTSDLAIACHGS